MRLQFSEKEKMETWNQNVEQAEHWQSVSGALSLELWVKPEWALKDTEPCPRQRWLTEAYWKIQTIFI